MSNLALRHQEAVARLARLAHVRNSGIRGTIPVVSDGRVYLMKRRREVLPAEVVTMAFAALQAALRAQRELDAAPQWITTNVQIWKATS